VQHHRRGRLSAQDDAQGLDTARLLDRCHVSPPFDRAPSG
jgi:hypothetical protein